MARQFTVIDCAQRSEAWFAARLGRVTGTTADAVMAQGRSKGSVSVQRVKLRYRLALERLTGRAFEKDFQTQAMADGVEREPLAFAAYEAQTGVLLDRAGFCSHTTQMVGCSVDGYQGDWEGLISIKCPEWHTHADTLRAKTIDTDYMRQIVHEQLVTGAEWTDFVSYHPAFPERLQLAIIRVPRNPEALVTYAVELEKFLTEVETEYQALKTMADPAAVLKEAVAS
jgi:hypothetical protein